MRKCVAVRVVCSVSAAGQHYAPEIRSGIFGTGTVIRWPNVPQNLHVAHTLDRHLVFILIVAIGILEGISL